MLRPLEFKLYLDENFVEIYKINKDTIDGGIFEKSSQTVATIESSTVESPSQKEQVKIELRELTMPAIVVVQIAGLADEDLGHCTMFEARKSPFADVCHSDMEGTSCLHPMANRSMHKVQGGEKEEIREKCAERPIFLIPQSATLRPCLHLQGYIEEKVEDFFAAPSNPATSPKEQEEDAEKTEESSPDLGCTPANLECTPTAGCDESSDLVPPAKRPKKNEESDPNLGCDPL